MNFINNVEIRVVSLGRSGHHGIINWIIGQSSGRVYCLNGAKPGKNPYQAYMDKEVKNIPEPEFSIGKEKGDKSIKKDYLIYSYEEFPLPQVFSKEFEKNHDKFLGKSSKRIDILVLRDPFNYFASKIKIEKLGLLDPNVPMRLRNKEAREFLIGLWKDYAKEYLGKTNYLKHNKIAISFNTWFSDKKYRQNLAKKLGLEFTDEGLNIITKSGPGSSFDRMKFDGQANKMRMLERWKHTQYYPFYREIFKDTELVDLSNKIFGKIKGTDAIFEHQSLGKNFLFTLAFKYLLFIGKIRYLVKKLIFPIRDRFIKKEKS